METNCVCDTWRVTIKVLTKWRDKWSAQWTNKEAMADELVSVLSSLAIHDIVEMVKTYECQGLQPRMHS